MSKLVSQGRNSGLVPFFARERLLHNSLEDKKAVSFSFDPYGKNSKYANKMKCSSVMKIEHILDLNADISLNYANSLKLIGCTTEHLEFSKSEKSGLAGNLSSQTFTVHVSKSGFQKALNHLNNKPTRRHQVKHDF
jgi:hypothetical protein